MWCNFMAMSMSWLYFHAKSTGDAYVGFRLELNLNSTFQPSQRLLVSLLLAFTGTSSSDAINHGQ